MPLAAPASAAPPPAARSFRDALVLTDALASLECEIVAEHPAGDHWIVLGRVERLHTSDSTDPLVFFDGAFAALRPRHP